MEKYTWRAKVVDGKMDEYIKRHNEIWQELKSTLKKAGISNYTIWADNNELFGYYECKKGIDFALKVQKESEIVLKWNEFMKDILIMEINNHGGQPNLKKVFELN